MASRTGLHPFVSEKKCGVGMFIEREPLRVKSEAFVHLQGRHPLRNILVNGKRQMEEILHLPFVVEIDLCDVHRCWGTVTAAPTITWILRVLPFDCGGRASLYRW